MASVSINLVLEIDRQSRRVLARGNTKGKLILYPKSDIKPNRGNSKKIRKSRFLAGYAPKTCPGPKSPVQPL